MAYLARVAAALTDALAVHFSRFRARWLAGTLVVAGVIACGYFALAAPAAFPSGQPVVVPSGASAAKVAQELSAAHVVRMPFALLFVWRATGAASHIHAGAYRFSKPVSVFTVAARIARGDFGVSPYRITFPEGVTVREIAQKVASAYPEVSVSDFVAAAGPYEGYLFPDTYIFAPDATAVSMRDAMRANFSARVAPLSGDIAASGHTLSDIVVMASLVEKEAQTPEDKAMVAGILWNRIAKHMPLQVDAVFGYIYDRSTFSPSYSQLKVDSPFNTYTQLGLPPAPIDNPGMDSIMAALHPAKTGYLFYLTGTDGQMHYAKTYAQHLANERAYLGHK